MIQELLGANVRGLRKQRGLTMKEAASLAGISEPGWQRVETGSRWPGPDTVEKIAQALGVHPPVLFAPERAWKAPDPTPEQALRVLAAAVRVPRR
jgi:transcriptional regulator with XRE-family HTH domain